MIKEYSLKGRLLLIALVTIAGALLFYGLSLSVVFERHVTRRIEKEINSHLQQLTAALQLSPQNTVTLTHEPAEPRFKRPFSGLYWQIEREGKVVLYSRSLWDQTLILPLTNWTPGVKKQYDDVTFNNTNLYVLERRVLIGPKGQEQSLRLIVAIDKNEITQARKAFSYDVLILLCVLALFLMLTTWGQVTIGLKPLTTLRQRLNMLSETEKPQMTGHFPSEVQSLVNELNALLKAREKALEKARAMAGDLAHGLKTPLAILAAEGRLLQDQGDTKISSEILQQVHQMNRHVERQLAKTRTRGPGNHFTSRFKPYQALVKISQTLARLPVTPDQEMLNWTIDVPVDMEIRFDPIDFNEVIGNILDNARKWARTRITISTLKMEDHIIFIFEDDGPGVPEENLHHIIKRGHRLDESIPGTGLGLAIVCDILEIYDISPEFKNVSPTGMQVRIAFPV